MHKYRETVKSNRKLTSIYYLHRIDESINYPSKISQVIFGIISFVGAIILLFSALIIVFTNPLTPSLGNIIARVITLGIILACAGSYIKMGFDIIKNKNTKVFGVISSSLLLIGGLYGFFIFMKDLVNWLF